MWATFNFWDFLKLSLGPNNHCRIHKVLDRYNLHFQNLKTVCQISFYLTNFKD